MQVKAKLSNARISPQKCRLVADMVRGKPVGQALNILKFSPKKGAALIYKVLSPTLSTTRARTSTTCRCRPSTSARRRF